MRLPRPLLHRFCAVPLLVTAACAGEKIFTAPPGQAATVQPANIVGVDQLAARDRPPLTTEPFAGTTPRTAEVNQLPPDATVSDDRSAPEPGLEIAPRHPKGDLYREVAQVWQQIRHRGQQPTPELLAKEIGPEALARLLAAYPNPERLFSDRELSPPREPTPSPEILDAQLPH